jgi:hypothetical protein
LKCQEEMELDRQARNRELAEVRGKEKEEVEA